MKGFKMLYMLYLFLINFTAIGQVKSNHKIENAPTIELNIAALINNKKMTLDNFAQFNDLKTNREDLTFESCELFIAPPRGDAYEVLLNHTLGFQQAISGYLPILVSHTKIYLDNIKVKNKQGSIFEIGSVAFEIE